MWGCRQAQASGRAPRFYLPAPLPLPGQIVRLGADEARHASRALRLREVLSIRVQGAVVARVIRFVELKASSNFKILLAGQRLFALPEPSGPDFLQIGAASMRCMKAPC